VKVWRRGEGFTVGAKSTGCGPVVIQDSFMSLVIPPWGLPPIVSDSWHTDGIQGYDGNAVTVSNVTVDFRQAVNGTAPFFYPVNQGNTRATVDHLLVMGGGFPFRLGTPGTVKGLKILDRSWSYGPIDVKCSLVSSWEAKRVTVDTAVWRTTDVADQPCNTEGGT
jgi:hypothetical protein